MLLQIDWGWSFATNRHPGVWDWSVIRRYRTSYTERLQAAMLEWSSSGSHVVPDRKRNQEPGTSMKVKREEEENRWLDEAVMWQRDRGRRAIELPPRPSPFPPQQLVSLLAPSAWIPRAPAEQIGQSARIIRRKNSANLPPAASTALAHAVAGCSSKLCRGRAEDLENMSSWAPVQAHARRQPEPRKYLLLQTAAAKVFNLKASDLVIPASPVSWKVDPLCFDFVRNPAKHHTFFLLCPQLFLVTF